jgi:hypothetical protein
MTRRNKANENRRRSWLMYRIWVFSIDAMRELIRRLLCVLEIVVCSREVKVVRCIVAENQGSRRG